MLQAIAMPFALLLRFLSEALNSYGFALIVFALIVTAIRVPFDIKGKRGTMGTMVLQPRIKEIQEKYAGNQQRIMQEQQKLYKEAGVKPMGGCIWTIFPMFIMIILFQIIREPLTNIMGLDQAQIEILRGVAKFFEYPVGTGAHAQTQLVSYMTGAHFADFQAAVPEIFRLNMNFLGMDIGRIPQWQVWTFTHAAQWGLFVLPILSTGAIYVSQKIMTATNYMQQQAQQAQMMKTMMLIMPLMSLFFGFTLPAAMSVYWIASSLMFTLCSVFINRHFKGIYAEKQAEVEKLEKDRQAKLEAKRKETERLRALNATKENKATSKKKKQLADREKERQRQADQRALDRENEDDEDNPSRVGHRKHARGRAYDPDRFERTGDEEVLDEDELVELPESYDDEDEFEDDDIDLYDDDEDDA